MYNAVHMRRGEEIFDPGRLEINRQLAISRLLRALDTPHERALREHQHTMLEKLHAFFSGSTDGEPNTSGYISAAMGVGKSAVMVTVAEILGMRTVVLSNNRRVSDQNRAAAEFFTPKMRVSSFDGRKQDLSGQTIFSIYPSMLSELKRKRVNGIRSPFEDMELVISDEVDTGQGEETFQIFRELFPNALFIGCTATPFFEQIEYYIRKGLINPKERWVGMFRNEIHELTLEEAWLREILAPVEIHLLRTYTEIPELDVLGNGEYSQPQLELSVDTTSRNARLDAIMLGISAIPDTVNVGPLALKELRELHQRVDGEPTLIHSVSIGHAERVARRLRQAGLRVGTIHSKITDDADRPIRDEDRNEVIDERIANFEAGKIQVLTGVNMLGRGIDVPSARVAIHTKPRLSARALIQEFGRITRPSPETGKLMGFAIQFVDQWSMLAQSGLLIPNVIKLDFIETHKQRYSSLRRKVEPGEKIPVDATKRNYVEVTGVHVESLLGEVEIIETVRNRFFNATPEEINRAIHHIYTINAEKDPDCGIYVLTKKVLRQLPSKIPVEVTDRLLKVIKDNRETLRTMDGDTDLSGRSRAQIQGEIDEATRAVIGVNLRAVMTVADYFEELPAEDYDDIFMTALSAMDGVIKGSYSSISSTINGQAKERVREYLAMKENVPEFVVEYAKFRLIIEEVGKLVEDDTLEGERLDRRKIEIVMKTGISLDHLEDYISYLVKMQFAITKSYQQEGNEGEEVRNELIRADIDWALSKCTETEQKVLKLRFGLDDGHQRTLEEVGKEFGVTRERIRQIEVKVLRKLRHPQFKRRLHPHIE